MTLGTIRRNMGRPGRDMELNYGFKMFILMKELQRREMDIFSVLFYLFLHGLESNPGSSLQTEEEAGLP